MNEHVETRSNATRTGGTEGTASQSVRPELVEGRESSPATRGSNRLAGRALAFLGTALPPLAVLVGLFLAWQLYVDLSGINAVTLPSPSRVFESGYRNRDLLWTHSLVTVKETLIGLFVSIILGVGLALLIDAFAPARRALYPLLVGSQTIPVVVIAPLLVLWFGFGLTPKIVVVTLYTFFPITVAFASGLAATDAESIILMRTLGAGRWRTMTLLRIPQALPYFFTGLRIAVTYATVGAVFAEWSGARNGLGIYVLLMKNSFRTDMVLAAIMLIAVLSLLLFLLVGLAEKLVVRWRD
ncbi:MAG TPA: ABC transporter permease [Dehalococcoidia bacterium]|nr:ABC transporter permease [Dehalococcoidia bacterium]